MKLMFIFDQIQAGAGGKERANVGLHAKRGSIGSAKMFSPIFNKLGIEVVATMYCGNQYYHDNQEEVQKKMLGMIKKVNPDAVLCGPAFNYAGYARMAADLTLRIKETLRIPVVSAFSVENEEVIEQYKNQICIVEMPKKGGIGLTDALETMTIILYKMFKQEDVQELIDKHCYK